MFEFRKIVLVLMIFGVVVAVYPQEKKAPAEAPKSITLTEDEKNAYDASQAKIDNLELRIQLMNYQVERDRQFHRDNMDRLLERLYKAHNLDR